MSTFTRTISGLNNQHLFHNVDLIVFLEGGSVSYNKQEVYAGKYSTETEDIIFWRNIFRKFFSDKKIKFKSIGSKSTIKDIVIDIVNGQLKTIMVAMDNEFDEVLKKQIKHPQVLYTNGYSWENDVWNSNVVKGVIQELSAVQIENDEIDVNLNQFTNKMKVAVNADGYLFKRNSSFFPRKTGYMFCIQCAPVDLPYIKESVLHAKLANNGLKKSNVNAFGRRHCIDTLKHCYGHLLADYCCQLIAHYLRKRHSLTTISNNILYRLAINKFFQLCFETGPIYEYYENQFKKNEA